MCCRTVRQGSRRFSWKRNAVLSASRPDTVPDWGRARPPSTRSRVVLPQPEGPVKAVSPSRGSSREKQSSTVLSP